MKSYADYQSYEKTYLLGRKAKIQSSEFAYWSFQASSVIRQNTFSRIDSMDKIPEEVVMCCCEIAERLYQAEAVRSEEGKILQSYGNDGETGTYKVDEFSENAIKRSVSSITRKWLASTGLMYCGVTK